MEELPAGLEDSSTLGNSDAHANTSQHSGCLPAHRDLQRMIILPRCATHGHLFRVQLLNKSTMLYTVVPRLPVFPDCRPSP